MITFYKH